MIIRNYKAEEQAKTPHGVQAVKMYDETHGVIMHLQIEAGESLKPHITPVDVAFYVVEGEPHIMVGEETIQVKQDDLVESPKDIPHCIFNKTEKPVRVLVMKLPRPTTSTKML
jgi:mannose-6-phosphate isomerase-like protein (cupin superfamily)